MLLEIQVQPYHDVLFMSRFNAVFFLSSVSSSASSIAMHAPPFPALYSVFLLKKDTGCRSNRTDCFHTIHPPDRFT